MGREMLDISPEALEVLREVAADPRSTLLRLEPSKSLAALREEALGPGRFTAGLNVAERELLRVHRNEIAWLLRQACLVMLIEGEDSRRFVSPFKSANERQELLAPEEIARRARLGPDKGDREGEEHNAAKLLAAFGDWPDGVQANISHLAAVSYRLEPTCQAQLIIALEMLKGQEKRTALWVIHQVLEAPSSKHYEMRAWEYAGFAHARLGNYAQACAALAMTCDGQEVLPDARMTRLVSALLAKEPKEVLSASRMLEETIPAGHETVDWFVKAMSLQRTHGDWAPDLGAQQLALELSDRLGDVGRRITDELF